MNNLLNSQRSRRSAWGNRISKTAWSLMAAIAIVYNLLVGYGSRRMHTRFFLVLPLAVSILVFLVADIDSRAGLIDVQPQELVSLYQSLKVQ